MGKYTVSYLLVAEGTDRVDDEAGLNGVEPNRSSLNGSACCDTVPLCVCERLDESLGTFGGGATVTNCSHCINVKACMHARTHTHTHTHTHTIHTHTHTQRYMPIHTQETVLTQTYISQKYLVYKICEHKNILVFWDVLPNI